MHVFFCLDWVIMQKKSIYAQTLSGFSSSFKFLQVSAFGQQTKIKYYMYICTYVDVFGILIIISI